MSFVTLAYFHLVVKKSETSLILNDCDYHSGSNLGSLLKSLPLKEGNFVFVTVLKSDGVFCYPDLSVPE